MSSLNSIQLIGRVGKDPETRNVNGKSVTTLTLATGETWKDKDGNKQESTEWFALEMWDALSQIADKYVTKGMLLYVQGKIKTDTWEKDGVKHYRQKVVVREMKMLSGNTPKETTVTNDVPASYGTESGDLPYPY